MTSSRESYNSFWLDFMELFISLKQRCFVQIAIRKCWEKSLLSEWICIFLDRYSDSPKKLWTTIAIQTITKFPLPGRELQEVFIIILDFRMRIIRCTKFKQVILHSAGPSLFPTTFHDEFRLPKIFFWLLCHTKVWDKDTVYSFLDWFNLLY